MPQIKEHRYFIYILTNKKNGTLYTGVTNSLLRRSIEHKEKEKKNSFTAKYDLKFLVYYEIYQNIQEVISREKQLKGWNRAWKIKLIEKENPRWRDFFDDMV